MKRLREPSRTKDLLVSLPLELLDTIASHLSALDLHSLGRSLVLTIADEEDWHGNLLVPEAALPFLAVVQRHLEPEASVWKRRLLARVHSLSGEATALDQRIDHLHEKIISLTHDPLFVVCDFLARPTCSRCVRGDGEHGHFGGAINLCTVCDHYFHYPRLLNEDAPNHPDGIVLVGVHALRKLCHAPKAHGRFAKQNGIRFIEGGRGGACHEFLLADILAYRKRRHIV